MYKHSTTHRTLSRRLVALLAVLALLAAMALPVYAEIQSEDTTKIAETVETVDETETTDDTTASTDSDDPADPTDDSTTAADDATDDTTPSADDTNTTPAGETTTDDTLDTSDEDTNNDGTDGANIENTGTADDAVAQPDNEVEDEVRVQEAAAKEVTIYFLAPSGFDTTATVKFNARIQGEQDHDNWYTAQMTDSGKADRNGRKIFFTTVYPGQHSCPYSGYSRIEFITSTANGDKPKSYWGLGQNSLEWTSVDTYADQIYDADAGTWTVYTPFDPNNHQTFAGKTMFFQNQSNTNLANVQAVFCEKTNNGLQPVETIDLKAIAVGKRVSFKIPEKDCTYIRFIVDGKETSLYNFYDQQDEVANNRHFFYDSGTACCYVYKESDDGSSWTIPQGTIKVYFDATFSSAYTEKGDTLSIPTKGSEDVYCCFKNEQTTPSAQKMTPCGDNLYSVDVPEGCGEIMFSGDNRTSPVNSGVSTDWVPIDWSLDKPCYMADTNDAVVYNNNAPRGGYWTEKKAVRDAETGKSTDGNQKDVVKVSQGTFVADPATKYISTTLYDYYTDYELNGNSRTDYIVSEGASHRNWVTFREFDQAISDYYKSYDEKEANVNKIRYPIYTGHFQPSRWIVPFADIAEKLNLYGWQDAYRTFISANNSAEDEGNSEAGKYDFAFQGIVANELSAQGDLLMNSGTKKAPAATTLVEPHFNESFLAGTNSKNAKLGEVYHNVSFPFTKKQIFSDEPGVDYWWYDSSKTSLYLREDTSKKQLYLGNDKNDGGKTAGYVNDKSKNLDSSGRAQGENSSDVKTQYGFFPFNESLNQTCVASQYNYGYGAKLEIPFSITSDGKVKSSTTDERVPIRYYFSGDDDVWVFIDNKLVLDVGGAHGKVSGILDFSQENGSTSTVTAYVSKVKYGLYNDAYYDQTNDSQPQKSIKYIYDDGNGTDYYQKNTFSIKDLTTGTHTLTMYYMERGMWESNMAVAFNFPDHNELQVQKIVDDNEVNDLFKGCFDNQRFFNFTIRNQATHYGTNDAKGDAVTTINLLQPGKSTPKPKDFTTTATHAPGTSGENRFIKVDSPPDKLKVTDGTPLLNWYTEFEDLTPAGSNKDKRYGILTLDKPIDITGMSYLSFDVYVDSTEGDAALSNMYLQLRDSNDKKKGCLGQTFIGGKDLYGQVEMHNNRWITVKLSLDDVKADDGFNKQQVKELRFGCNYPRSIYLRNIVFSSKAVPQTVTGFTTKQQDIADYGSAASGTLKPAVNAQYTSDAEKGTMVVDKNGGFVLKTGETISFKDQFRRGSYLSINEQVDKDLFDTQWTIYEDGKAVKSTTAGVSQKLTLKGNKSLSLENQTGTAPDDGRIENVKAEGDAAQNGNSYKGEKPSTNKQDDNTIVFRSYANPDATDADGETQLKVVFVNTVKTGSLTIKKEQDGKGEKLTGKTYKFMVRFTNVGGHALEDEAIVVPYEVTVDEPYVIENIPVGTRFTIEEVTPTDGSKLTHASVTGGGSGTMVLSNNTVRGSIVEGVAGRENQAVATFTNTKQETLDLTGTKIWKNADNTDMTGSRPTIYVQLQRRHKDESKWEAVEYRDNEPYQTITDGYGDMTFSFLGLPAKDYSIGNKPDFEYRVVEGYLDKEGAFHAVENKGTITIDEKVYGVTYEYTKPETDAVNNNNTKQTVTITNTQQDPKFTLDITKADAETGTTPLKDVEFTLEKLTKDDNGNTVADASFGTLKGKTNGQGKLVWKKDDNSEVEGFTELKAGTYRLTETKAAKDYNLLSAPILVTFDKDGTCTLNGSKIEVSTSETKTDFTKDGNDRYTLKLTVLNRKTPALPHTGADAPSLWLLIGLPLAVAGLLILVFRYNKKGGRTR